MTILQEIIYFIVFPVLTFVTHYNWISDIFYDMVSDPDSPRGKSDIVGSCIAWSIVYPVYWIMLSLFALGLLLAMIAMWIDGE